jgi:alpha-L-rhamnosidase
MHSSETGSPAPIRLRVDGRWSRSTRSGDRFLALATGARPRVSWEVPLIGGGQRQRAFRVVLRAPAGTSIDSGVVESSDPWWIVAEELPPHGRWEWAVSVMDESGRWSAESAEALETGPLRYEDWESVWVEVPPSSTLRIPLTLARPATHARLHLTAQGLVRAEWDGIVINPGSVDPSRTDPVRALYRSYDLGDLCTEGPHLLELSVGRGAWDATGLDPRVLALVSIDHPDGTVSRFGTGDAAASIVPSRVVVDDPFYLERHDLRTAVPLEKPPTRRAATRRAVALTPDDVPSRLTTPPREVHADPGPAVRAIDAFETAELPGTDGHRIFDVGTNIAGRVSVRLVDPVPTGTTVRLVHGEHLIDGRVDTTNLTLPHDAGRVRQAVEFVVSGEECVDGRRLEAWFAYSGFRYVDISGLGDARVEVVAHSVHSDLLSTGDLTTDSPLVEGLVATGRRTLLNNVHGIPEDCPTREQAGWTGDTASVTDFEFAAFDVESFFTKWLGDLRSSQGADGAIPAVAPHLVPPAPPADPVWGAALQRVLLDHWLQYGDRRQLDATMPALRAWCDWLLTCVGATGIVDGAPISYGHDWLALHQTPPELLHTAAAIDAFDVLGRLETDSGHPDAAIAARANAQRLRAAARRVFVAPDTAVVANGTQAATAIALAADLLLGSERAAAVARLVSSIRGEGDRVTSGFATTRTVVRALAAAGEHALILDVLRQSQEPGVGAMLDHGPGTFWECWWIDPTNTGTGSLDHVGLGGPFAAWAFRSLAGVEPLTAGFERARIAPHPIAGVERLSLTMQTIRGPLSLAWEREGEHLALRLTIPVSMTVVAVLADGEHELSAGFHRFALPLPLPPASTAPAPVVRPAFATPVRAPLPADLDREPDILGEALRRSAVRPLGGATLEVLDDGLVCMPVPHEQESGPVIRVTGEGSGSTALAALDVDLDLSGASFVAARVDLDLPVTSRRLESVIVLHGADGTELRGTNRIWPAGWNRVGVDVGTWTGRSRVIRIDVGVVASGAADGLPAATHIAAVGWSASPRRW